MFQRKKKKEKKINTHQGAPSCDCPPSRKKRTGPRKPSKLRLLERNSAKERGDLGEKEGPHGERHEIGGPTLRPKGKKIKEKKVLSKRKAKGSEKKRGLKVSLSLEVHTPPKLRI